MMRESNFLMLSSVMRSIPLPSTSVLQTHISKVSILINVMADTLTRISPSVVSVNLTKRFFTSPAV